MLVHVSVETPAVKPLTILSQWPHTCRQMARPWPRAVPASSASRVCNCQSKSICHVKRGAQDLSSRACAWKLCSSAMQLPRPAFVQTHKCASIGHATHMCLQIESSDGLALVSFRNIWSICVSSAAVPPGPRHPKGLYFAPSAHLLQR